MRTTVAPILLLLAMLLLPGCREPGRRPPPPEPYEAPTQRTDPPPRAAPTTPPRELAQPVERPQAPLPERTGIPACDDYLDSYFRCHAVVGTYPPEQLESRFEATRKGLVQRARDEPLERVAATCTSLAGQMREALRGRECLPER